jgi:hypothetical protein
MLQLVRHCGQVGTWPQALPGCPNPTRPVGRYKNCCVQKALGCWFQTLNPEKQMHMLFVSHLCPGWLDMLQLRWNNHSDLPAPSYVCCRDSRIYGLPPPPPHTHTPPFASPARGYFVGRRRTLYTRPGGRSSLIPCTPPPYPTPTPSSSPAIQAAAAAAAAAPAADPDFTSCRGCFRGLPLPRLTGAAGGNPPAPAAAAVDGGGGTS